MSLLTEKDYSTRFPNNNTEYFDTLNSNQKEMYIKCLNYYYEVFVSYLVNKLDLKKHDQNLSNSKNNFIKVTPEKMDIYQSLSSFELNYLYLRNNIYLEHLTKEEINLLYTFMMNNIGIDSTELISFIEKTYPRLIFETKEVTNINFGPESSSFIAPSNNIIIGIRIDDFQDAELVPNWEELHNNREFELEFFINYLKNELQNKLSVPVTIIRYDDLSVKKKHNSDSLKIAK